MAEGQLAGLDRTGLRMLKTYVLWIGIVDYDRLNGRRQVAAELELERFVMTLGHARNWELYDDYRVYCIGNAVLANLYKRENPSDASELASELRHRVNSSPLEYQIRIGIHFSHNIHFPDIGRTVELPTSGGRWAGQIQRAAQPGQILVSPEVYEELVNIEVYKRRLRFAWVHDAQVPGQTERLYELDMQSAPVHKP